MSSEPDDGPSGPDDVEYWEAKVEKNVALLEGLTKGLVGLASSIPGPVPPLLYAAAGLLPYYMDRLRRAEEARRALESKPTQARISQLRAMGSRLRGRVEDQS